MANNYTSLKLSYTNAYDFSETFSDIELDDHIRYVFLSNSTPYDNESVIPSIEDTAVSEKEVWDKMFAAKRVTGNDVEMVVPRINWSNSTVYKQYDDTVDLSSLLPDSDGANSIYVLTSDLNVYKCIYNNSDGTSTVEPSGYQYTANGYFTTADNYVWKYMYSIKPSNKFLTTEWMPAPTSVNILGYNTSSENLLDGAVANIVVENGGSGYIHSSFNTYPFEAGVTSIKANTVLTGIAVNNMIVDGTGILPGSKIIDVDYVTSIITLSEPTTSSGGGSGNTVNITTGVFVVGNGNDDTVVTVNLSGTSIDTIEVDSVGTGYSYAAVEIYGTGSSATARAIIAPKFGHGFNPAKELGSSAVMISKIIGQLDSTEGNLISIDTSFRQYGLLNNPHKYGETTSILHTDANTVISQTTDLTIIGGSPYTLNEIVFQGSTYANSTFSGIVHAQDSNVVRLTNIRGTPTIGGLLVGDTSTVQRAVSSVNNPEFEPYTGDIVYVENALATNRIDGQAEIIKFVIKF